MLTIFFFPGLITRSEAEEILIQRPIGSFLVRVSERIWGFTISYQSEERCKHFLIDASDGTYHFFGTNYQVYSSLHEIITHHTVGVAFIVLVLQLQESVGLPMQTLLILSYFIIYVSVTKDVIWQRPFPLEVSCSMRPMRLHGMNIGKSLLL